VLGSACQRRWLPCPAGTSFDSWVLPGIGLLVAIGVLPTIALLGEARRRPWATLAHVAVGGVLVGWIVLQLVLIGYVARRSRSDTSPWAW
jgi:hypothetical protein